MSKMEANTEMAIPEVCAMWIQERVSAAVESKDPATSWRAMSREIVAEVERLFEVRVHENTILSRLSREEKYGVSNETPQATAENDCGKCVAGCSNIGKQITQKEAIAKVQDMVADGVSISEAARIIAPAAGVTPSTLRVEHYRCKQTQKDTSAAPSTPADAPSTHQQTEVQQQLVPATPKKTTAQDGDYANMADQMADLAILQLSRIMPDDVCRREALLKVRRWVDKQLGA